MSVRTCEDPPTVINDRYFFAVFADPAAFSRVCLEGMSLHKNMGADEYYGYANFPHHPIQQSNLQGKRGNWT
jgi:hypothetical protein